MKTKFTTLLFLVASFASQNVNSQTLEQLKALPPEGYNSCGFDEGRAIFEKNHPEAIKENEAREKFVQQYILDHPNESSYNSGRSVLPKYRIPVVFHVYGGASHTFWGLTVTKAKIDSALVYVNKDFNGLNDDFNSVHNNFKTIRGTMDISFELALKKPNGTVTDGVDWITTKTGAGYAPNSVAADAWDNKKYYNIYIVADLYNDGSSTNSGYTLYPNVANTNNNEAKTVYNGQYLGSNTSKEFASTLSHELAHAFFLLHTFENGCNSPGDNVSDTPPVSNNNLQCHSSPTSTAPTSTCTGTPLVNVENYMDYSGRFSCYKMFTKGQITRMDGYLNVNDVTLKPLWQQSNLITTGILSSVGINLVNDAVIEINVFPNPSNGIFQLNVNTNKQDNYTLEVKDVLGRVIYSSALVSSGNYKTTIDLQEQPTGIYFVSVSSSNGNRVIKVVKE